MPTEPPTTFKEPRPRAHRLGASFDDLTQSLVWPKLLLAPGLALRPDRLLMGVLAVLALAIVNHLPQIWNRDSEGVLLRFGHDVEAAWAQAQGTGWSGQGVSEAIFDIVWRIPASMVRQSPVLMLVTWLLAAATSGLLAAAICRSGALSIAGENPGSIGRSVRFAAGKFVSVIGVIFTPCIVLSVIIGVMGVLGWAQWWMPWLAPVLVGILVLIGVAATLLVLGIALAWLLMIPALASEGSDAIDAMQRTLAYAKARPARLMVYGVLVSVVGAVAIWAALLAMHLLMQVTFAGMTLLLQDGPAGEFGRGLRLAGEFRGSETIAAEGMSSLLRGSLRMWAMAIHLVVAGYIFSYVCTAATLVYVAMRRVVDGQDIAEIWLPTMVPGTRIDAGSLTEGDE